MLLEVGLRLSLEGGCKWKGTTRHVSRELLMFSLLIWVLVIQMSSVVNINQSILRIRALFCILYPNRKLHRKFKWLITFYSHECVLGIRNLKCASWNIYHWKKGIFKESVSLWFIIEEDRSSLICTIILEMDKHILHQGPLVVCRAH